MDGKWQFWIDRGGTFTDVVAAAPDGRLLTAKLLSSDPARPGDAAVAAIRQLTGVAAGPLPPAEVRMGTTVATNALLERKGEPVVLAITAGFGDALRIGYQERPELFVRRIVKPEPLHARVIEIDERVGADGALVRPLDEDAARVAFAAAYADGFRAIAILLMHGYAHPAHEARLAQLARVAGFTQISVSHEVAPLIKLVGRGDTTLIDAYLSPVLRRYIEGFTGELGPQVPALFMQSSGGLIDAAHFRGKDAILSGPAGGIVGMARTAAAAGFDRVIGFDMGGTSTDVSHYAGAYERDSETSVAGARIRAPMLRIHTVAAGGGSICRFDGMRLVVGPESAGAVPGPACYRRGGPLTVTDCNVLLGKVRPDHFPRLFGPGGDEPIDRAVVVERFTALAADIAAATGQRMTNEAIAEGFLTIAVANMAQAIKTISVARGHDVTAYSLVCFGGAAGQHGCLVADQLQIDSVLIHPFAGALSAYGMGLAQQTAIRERTLALPCADDALAAVAAAEAALAAEAGVALGVADSRIAASLFVRVAGSDNAIELPVGDAAAIRAAFAERHRAEFGYAASGELVIDRLRVTATAGDAAAGLAAIALPVESAPPLGEGDIYGDGGWRRVPIHDRAGLAADFAADGPLLIVDPLATTMVEPGWRVRVLADGSLHLTRATPRAADRAGTTLDPVRLEIFNGLFMGIAEEMGSALARTATSVNIRERLDFSCALFDAAGRLVANAPHMPVHLGSMGESVQTILRKRGGGLDGRGIRRGDAYLINAPYEGGTHLPDMTVVMPVFVDGADEEPAFFVAARGHHADIGGISPGSMPPDSRTVDEEGILFDNVLLVDEGRLCEGDIRARLAAGRWPSRNPDQNIADLGAQIAACARGEAELRRICDSFGRDVVAAYMAHVHDHAAEAVRRLIGRLADGQFRYAMDNGAEVAVAVRVDRAARHVRIDFAGTSAQLPGNFNAPFSVVRAAVMYVLRTMIDDAIPMNDGCLAPVTIHVPAGSMLNPRPPAAVVAGNVETSQVVTDALFGAFGALAASQGTMNNFTFGNDRHQYYETIAGGAGAGPDFDGASVVQTHMTNSRLTDPEVLESRFPVRLEAFAIRRGSGGAGRHRGGDGAVRRIRFLEPMQAGILANHRIVAPFGLAGGGDGAVGVNRVERADGGVEALPATASVTMGVGDLMHIETPGGGGFGEG